MKHPSLFSRMAFCHLAYRTSLNNPCPLMAQTHGALSVLFLSDDSHNERGNLEDSEQTMQILSPQEQDDQSMFFDLMTPSSAQPDQMSASALAYLGDVLFELFIRSRYVWPNRKMSALQNKVVSIVRGKTNLELGTALHQSQMKHISHQLKCEMFANEKSLIANHDG